MRGVIEKDCGGADEGRGGMRSGRSGYIQLVVRF